MDPSQSIVPSKRPVETETCSSDPTPEPKRSRADSEAHTPLSDAQPQQETAPDTSQKLDMPTPSSAPLDNTDASASIPPQQDSDATPVAPQSSTDPDAPKSRDGKDKKRNDSGNQGQGKGGGKSDKKKDKKSGKDSWSRRGTRKEGETRPEGEEKATRLPKRQCALLIGFCGTGCNGMQMYVLAFLYAF